MSAEKLSETLTRKFDSLTDKRTDSYAEGYGDGLDFAIRLAEAAESEQAEKDARIMAVLKTVLDAGYRLACAEETRMGQAVIATQNLVDEIEAALRGEGGPKR